MPSDTRFYYRIPAKTYLLKECGLPSAANRCVRAFTHEWSFSSREIFVFKIHFLLRDDKHAIVQVFARFWKIAGLVWSRHGYFGSTEYKPWLDQTRPDIFPNRTKTSTVTYKTRSRRAWKERKAWQARTTFRDETNSQRYIPIHDLLLQRLTSEKTEKESQGQIYTANETTDCKVSASTSLPIHTTRFWTCKWNLGPAIQKLSFVKWRLLNRSFMCIL